MTKPLLLAALVLGACAAMPASDQSARSLAAAEAAFAAHSVREDMRAAFLAAFADDGVFVRDGWRVGSDWLRDRPAPPIVLDWRPAYAEAAASGDMGLSTGPWKITSKARPDAPPAFGQFVSVWKRTGAGPWKVAVDLGISHPGPALWDAPLVARPAETKRGSADAGGLAEAEAAFDRLSRAGEPRAAYRALGTASLRFYREGHEPRASLEAALAHPAMPSAAVAWKIDRLETARSGDFGYARGEYAAPGAASPAGYFLRVWRREAAGWRIVLDVANARG